MSSSTANAIRLVSNRVYGYGLIFVTFSTFLSCAINIPLFSSKNYRKNPYSLYILTYEINNCLEILLFVLPAAVRFLTRDSSIGGYVWCKMTSYFGDIFYCMPILVLCLASIDRYYATSRTAQLRQRSTMKMAIISILIVICLSLLLPSANLFYYDVDYTFNVSICLMVSETYNIYYSYVFIFSTCTCLPTITLTVFGLLTYRNIKHLRRVRPAGTSVIAMISHTVDHVPGNIAVANNNNHSERTIVRSQNPQPVIGTRQRLDEQFSTILIAQISFFVVTSVPIAIKFIYSTVTANNVKSDTNLAMEGLFLAITTVMALIRASSTFSFYYLSSSSYRKNVNNMICKKRQIRLAID